jgi:hypothetical protein
VIKDRNAKVWVPSQVFHSECLFVCVLVQGKPSRSIKKMATQHRSHTDVHASPATMWTELPEYVFEAVVGHLQGDKEVSVNFKRVYGMHDMRPTTACW